jgi:UDP-N-acetylglucosamine---dolichyl-phosphate N-acetylglucosaminyltransferase
MDISKCFVILPIYNEDKIIEEVIRDVKKCDFNNIIIVDDGSTDNTDNILRKYKKLITLKHLINRGKGAAIKTGMEAAKLLGADSVVTMDGDGQHNPEEIYKMAEYIDSGYDVVLGIRTKNKEVMPANKKFFNFFGNFFTWIIYGLWVNDSQSGFRAYSKKAIQLIDTKNDRYEYDSEIIKEISWHKLKFIEIPIEVRYTNYSMGKIQKQNFKNGIKTLIKMLISN